MSELKTVVLCVLDGWGEAPADPRNAIALAHTPHFDALKQQGFFTTLDASGHAVGLPAGQMGNSEVGHMTIGSGRVVFQDLPRIDQAVAHGTLAQNPNLLKFINELKTKGSGLCHVMGLLSPGGVHSHENHILELINILQKAGIEVQFHAILDGRDTPPQSALESLKRCPLLPATISGRFYAMDRDNRWERTKQAFDNLMAQSSSPTYTNPEAYVAQSYENFVNDEFVVPAHQESFQGMQNGDGLIMANFRADRVRQILRSLLNPDFSNFERIRVPQFAATLGLTEYASDLTPLIPAMFPAQKITQTLGEIVSAHGLKQMRIAETEKYAHVTFFLNGGREEPYEGEDRLLIPSPAVTTYDLKPEMSASAVCDGVIEALFKGIYSLIVVNFANTDMVGHSGLLEPSIKAVEAVDQCLGRLQKAIDRMHATLIITADHGNAECMENQETHEPHTAHTTNFVPFICYPSNHPQESTQDVGGLQDITPTVLSLLGLPVPSDVTGQSIIG